MPDRDGGLDEFGEKVTEVLQGVGAAWIKALADVFGAVPTQDQVTLFKGFAKTEPAPDESPDAWLATVVRGAIEEQAPFLTMDAVDAIADAAVMRARGMGMTLRPG